MTLLANNARIILREALDSPCGIQIDIEASQEMIAPAARAKQVLYRFSQEDVEFANLQIVFGPDDPDRTLWIIKKESGDGR